MQRFRPKKFTLRISKPTPSTARDSIEGGVFFFIAALMIISAAPYGAHLSLIISLAGRLPLS